MIKINHREPKRQSQSLVKDSQRKSNPLKNDQGKKISRSEKRGWTPTVERLSRRPPALHTRLILHNGQKSAGGPTFDRLSSKTTRE